MRELVIGGSGSGKSEYAEAAVCRMEGIRYYIATMEPLGEEGRRRVERHRKQRQDKGFATLEKYTDLEQIKLPEQGCVLLECIGNLVANEMYYHGYDISQKILRGIRMLERQSRHLVVVTNDVFRDGRNYDEFTENYIDNIGYINSVLAKQFEKVTEVVAGIPLEYKAGGIS